MENTPSEILFTVPIYFDYGATFLWGTSGAMIAARRGYDVSGVIALALLSATGGGLIRDGLFLQNGPPVLVQTPIYLLIVAAAAVLVLVAGARLQQVKQFSRLVQIVDAFGLGAYAVVGMQMSIQAQLSTPAVILVGVVNAVGGGLLRDIAMRQVPELFKPGTFTGIAALASCFVFLALQYGWGFSPALAAWPTIAAAFTIRMLSVKYNLRTRPVSGFGQAAGGSLDDEK